MYGHQRLYIQTFCWPDVWTVIWVKWFSIKGARYIIEFIFSASCCWIASKECLRAYLKLAVRMWWECEVVAGRTAAGHSNDGCPLSRSPRGHSQLLSFLLSSFLPSTISSLFQPHLSLQASSPPNDCPQLHFSTIWVPNSPFLPIPSLLFSPPLLLITGASSACFLLLLLSFSLIFFFPQPLNNKSWMSARRLC